MGTREKFEANGIGERVWPWLLILVLLGGSLWLMVSNYGECRKNGFSRTYCTFTHLVR